MDDKIASDQNLWGRRTRLALTALSLFSILLLPFCAIPSLTLAPFQYNDLGKIGFSLLGVAWLLSGSIPSKKYLRNSFLVVLYLGFANSLACIFLEISSKTPNISVLHSTLKLTFWLSFSIFLPAAGILSCFRLKSQSFILRAASMSIIPLLFISACQLLLLLKIKGPIQDSYSRVWFKYLEGTWGGNLSLPRIHSSVLDNFRIAGTFEEPSLFAQYCLFFCIPLIAPRILYREVLLSKWIDRIILLIIMLFFIFTFSTTGYLIAMADVALILFGFGLSGGVPIYKKIVIPGIIACLFSLLIYSNFDRFVEISARAFITGNQSSNSRLGSMIGGLNLLKDFPMGVGFSNETRILYEYLPHWGRTVETSHSYSVLHSAFLRLISQTGLLGAILFCLLGAFAIISIFRSRHLTISQSMAVRLWSLNFIAASIYTDIQFGSAWFVFSCILVFFPVYSSFQSRSGGNGVD